MIYFTISCILLVIATSWAWANSVEDMIKNHPNYKGEDMLDDYPPKEDKWDDNRQHTEQNF